MNAIQTEPANNSIHITRAQIDQTGLSPDKSKYATLEGKKRPFYADLIIGTEPSYFTNIRDAEVDIDLNLSTALIFSDISKHSHMDGDLTVNTGPIGFLRYLFHVELDTEERIERLQTYKRLLTSDVRIISHPQVQDKKNAALKAISSIAGNDQNQALVKVATSVSTIVESITIYPQPGLEYLLQILGFSDKGVASTVSAEIQAIKMKFNSDKVSVNDFSMLALLSDLGQSTLSKDEFISKAIDYAVTSLVLNRYAENGGFEGITAHDLQVFSEMFNTNHDPSLLVPTAVLGGSTMTIPVTNFMASTTGIHPGTMRVLESIVANTIGK